MTDYAETALVRSMSFLAESQSAISHNLANADTTSFKRLVPVARYAPQHFEGVLGEELRAPEFSADTDWTAGALVATGDPNHIAIDGDGYFMVEDDHGRRYFTRDGSMHRDVAGRLVNDSGHWFLDEDGARITLPTEFAGDGQIRISPNGTVTDGDRRLARLGVFTVPEPHRLVPAGNSQWIDTAGQQPAAARNATIEQGSLERSNVEALSEMVQMIVVQRSYQAASHGLSSLAKIKSAFIAAMSR